MARGRRAPAVDRVTPPEPTSADLHAHTSRSDGLLEPAALVAAAAEAGLRLLAITDHDTLAGYREVTEPGAAPLPADLALIPGVEINAVARGLRDLPDGELHVVGLGVDPDDGALEAALTDQRARRRARFAAMVVRLRDAGFGIDAQLDGLDLDRQDSLGRPTLAPRARRRRSCRQRPGRVRATRRPRRPGLRPARGPEPVRGDPRHPGRGRHRRPRPLLDRADPPRPDPRPHGRWPRRDRGAITGASTRRPWRRWRPSPAASA